MRLGKGFTSLPNQQWPNNCSLYWLPLFRCINHKCALKLQREQASSRRLAWALLFLVVRKELVVPERNDVLLEGSSREEVERKLFFHFYLRPNSSQSIFCCKLHSSCVIVIARCTDELLSLSLLNILRVLWFCGVVRVVRQIFLFADSAHINKGTIR